MDTGQDYSATHEHETRRGKRVVEEILATPILDERGARSSRSSRGFGM